MPRRCYILGAGFSRTCGLPLARELTECVVRHLAAADDAAVADFIAPAVRGWTGFIRQLYPVCDFEATWPDFEDLITVLDEW